MNKHILITILFLLSSTLCKISTRKLNLSLEKYNKVELTLFGWKVYDFVRQDKLLLGGLSHNLIQDLSKSELQKEVVKFIIEQRISEKKLNNLFSLMNKEISEVKELISELNEYGLRRERLVKFVEEYSENENYKKLLKNELYNYESIENSEDDKITKNYIYDVIYLIVIQEGDKGKENLRNFISKAEASKRN